MPRALTLLLVTGAALGGSACSLFNSAEEQAYDYRKAVPRNHPLEVPPDLTPVGRDERTGAGSAAAAAATGANANAANANAANANAANANAPGASGQVATAPFVAVGSGAAQSGAAQGQAGAAVAPEVRGARLVRDGAQRWLATDVSPEAAYAATKELFSALGMKLAFDDPAAGWVETDWVQTRPEIEEDALRNGLHKVLGAFDSSGLRDRYRVRIERTAQNTAEVIVTHRGLAEVETASHDSTHWQWRAPDPELEALMLRRLALRLGPLKVAVSVAAIENPAPVSAAGPALPETVTPARAHKLTAGGHMVLQVEDNAERTWRRVGMALDRGGFTVEERHRDTGVYAVRYLDPDYEARTKESRGWWDKIFNSDAKVPEQKFQIAVLVAGANAAGGTTTVEVRDREGRVDNGETAQRILDQLLEQLR